jgi:hypothetical protein
MNFERNKDKQEIRHNAKSRVALAYAKRTDKVAFFLIKVNERIFFPTKYKNKQIIKHGYCKTGPIKPP